MDEEEAEEEADDGDVVVDRVVAPLLVLSSKLNVMMENSSDADPDAAAAVGAGLGVIEVKMVVF